MRFRSWEGFGLGGFGLGKEFYLFKEKIQILLGWFSQPDRIGYLHTFGLKKF